MTEEPEEKTSDVTIRIKAHHEDARHWRALADATDRIAEASEATAVSLRRSAETHREMAESIEGLPPSRLKEGRISPLETCSFCGKDRLQVDKMIAGPSVFICDVCVGLCVEIIEDKDESEGER